MTREEFVEMPLAAEMKEKILTKIKASLRASLGVVLEDDAITISHRRYPSFMHSDVLLGLSFVSKLAKVVQDYKGGLFPANPTDSLVILFDAEKHPKLKDLHQQIYLALEKNVKRSGKWGFEVDEGKKIGVYFHTSPGQFLDPCYKEQLRVS